VLADYRRKLFTVLGSSLVFAGLAGALVTRTGLRPLRAIAHTTQRITASNLAERLHPAEWPAELRELAAAFDAMLDRLQDSFGRLTEFSANIAHALRNPINNLRGEAEVALGHGRTAEEYQQILGSSLEECERLARMIDSLLFIARTDNPDASIERSVIAARRELDAVQEFYEALAAETEVAVVCEGDATLTGDPMLFRRAVSNLLANALKHTPRTGRVVLAAANLPDGSAEIRVSDTGDGIPAEHLPRIFDRFYRADDSRNRRTGGAGLGLAICKAIADAHGGSLEVSSAIGKGSAFTLRIPT
jgi:two-component system, OmpR family, heavy metal sensor histidine kinase CusS